METYSIYESPIGDLLIVADEENLLNIRFERFYDKYKLQELDNIENRIIQETKIQLEEYFNKEREKFNLPIKLEGTEFQKKCWEALIEIPYGEKVTYKDIAERVSIPKAYRAVGLANNRNPIPIVVPCHRVIGSDGSLVGYAGGLDIKTYLLDLER